MEILYISTCKLSKAYASGTFFFVNTYIKNL